MVLLACFSNLTAQEYFPTNSEIKSVTRHYTAFTNAKIFVTPTQIINKGTLLIKDGKIVNVGTNISLPKNTIIVNVSGKYIYPSFIDLYSDFGIKKLKSTRFNRSARPQYDSKKDGYYWNDHVLPEKNAIDGFVYSDKDAKQLLNAGFGTVLTNRKTAIARGTSVLVTLNKFDNNHTRVIAKKVL